jgi:hypothetical protein
MYTGGVKVECVNINHQRNHPSYFSYGDLEVAKLLSKHVLLTREQIKACGFATRRLGHMVKFGLLYRYRVLDYQDNLIVSAYAVGPAAKFFLSYPIVGMNNPYKVQSMLAINQVLIYIMSRAPEARIDINLHRPVQAIVTINNPLGICAPRKSFDRTFLSRHNISQAIVVLPDRNLVSSGLPVRYCFDDELDDPFNLKFYLCRSGVTLEQVALFPGDEKEETDKQSGQERAQTKKTVSSSSKEVQGQLFATIS